MKTKLFVALIVALLLPLLASCKSQSREERCAELSSQVAALTKRRDDAEAEYNAAAEVCRNAMQQAIAADVDAFAESRGDAEQIKFLWFMDFNKNEAAQDKFGGKRREAIAWEAVHPKWSEHYKATMPKFQPIIDRRYNACVESLDAGIYLDRTLSELELVRE